jgi:hypothetical protein
VRAANLAQGLKPSTSRLLVYMADRAREEPDGTGLFWVSRARTVHELGQHSDTVKAALRELIRKGYASEHRPARSAGPAGRGNTRVIRLHPSAWSQPEPWRASAVASPAMHPSRPRDGHTTTAPQRRSADAGPGPRSHWGIPSAPDPWEELPSVRDGSQDRQASVARLSPRGARGWK